MNYAWNFCRRSVSDYISLEFAFASLRQQSGAWSSAATRTFFGDNTRHNRAQHTSAHTNGKARRLLSGQGVVAFPPLLFPRSPVKLTSAARYHRRRLRQSRISSREQVWKLIARSNDASGMEYGGSFATKALISDYVEAKPTIEVVFIARYYIVSIFSRPLSVDLQIRLTSRVTGIFHAHANRSRVTRQKFYRLLKERQGTCCCGRNASRPPFSDRHRYLNAEKAWLPLWGKKGSFAMAIMSPWRRRRRRYQK